MYACDACGNDGTWMVGNIATGDQKVYCDEHYGTRSNTEQPARPLTSAAITVIPGLCELCDAEPTAVVMITAEGGDRIAYGSRCLLVQGQLAFRAAPAEIQEAVTAAVDATEAQQEPSEGDGGGRPDELAVDEPGGTGAPVETPNPEPQPEVKPSPEPEQDQPARQAG